MSWFWMAFFLILSAVAVGIPFILPLEESPEPASIEDDLSYRRRRLESSIRDLDLDLAAGKLSADNHATARKALEEELQALGRVSPVLAGSGGPAA